jgi:aminoglycoside phosphotransferase (APT) family kinase protein
VSQIVNEIDCLRSQINDTAVCEHASRLNGGRSCKVEHSSKVGPGALMGCANYHARIRFHDGSPSWLLRVPRVTSFAVGLPVSLADYLILSEYATLKFLETTAVPAPQAFSYGICSNGTDHGVGVSFLLTEELPGRPWTCEGVSGNEATQGERIKVWTALADILAELEKHPWPKAGSLCFQSSSIDVSAVASDRFVVLTPEGPFDTSTSYYTAFAEQYLTLIADGQLYTEYPVDAYLVYRFLKDNVVQLAQQDTEEAQVPEKFFLKHADDKGDHLLVDDNLNITGIIDWQMARVVPRREAFGLSLVTADMSALCGGKVSLSVDDVALATILRGRGSLQLASCMADEKVRRFFWGLALEPKWSYALPLANAILKVFGVDQDWTTWRETALSEYEADERLRALVHRSCH